MSETIEITLSSANMGGDASEADFDAWAAYVTAHIGEAADLQGEAVTVTQRRFGDSSPDGVEGASDECRATILDELAHGLWDAFCADGAAWPSREVSS